MTNRHHPHY